MNFKFCLFLLLTLSVASCDDPCDLDANSIDCPTGDFDGDGLVNDEDSAPEDACAPNLPSIEDNIIGIWDWTVDELDANPGQVKFNDDGTYEDIIGDIISFGTITYKNWRIENGFIYFEVNSAAKVFELKDYDCDTITLYSQAIPSVIFTRI